MCATTVRRRDECFSLSPPWEKRVGKRLTFLPRILFRGQGKSRQELHGIQPLETATWVPLSPVAQGLEDLGSALPQQGSRFQVPGRPQVKSGLVLLPLL